MIVGCFLEHVSVFSPWPSRVSLQRVPWEFLCRSWWNCHSAHGNSEQAETSSRCGNLDISSTNRWHTWAYELEEQDTPRKSFSFSGLRSDGSLSWSLSPENRDVLQFTQSINQSASKKALQWNSLFFIFTLWANFLEIWTHWAPVFQTELSGWLLCKMIQHWRGLAWWQKCNYCSSVKAYKIHERQKSRFIDLQSCKPPKLRGEASKTVGDSAGLPFFLATKWRSKTVDVHDHLLLLTVHLYLCFSAWWFCYRWFDNVIQ